MQRASSHEFWAERRRNIAKMDSVLYGHNMSKKVWSENMLHAETSDPQKDKVAASSRDHLRSYADSLERDNAISKLEEKNKALMAKIASQEKEMESIQV